MALINPLLGGNLAASGFDTTLISNSIWLDGSGTSGDSLTRSWGTPSNEDRWIWSTWYCPLREADSTGNRGNIFASGSGSNGFYLIHTSNDSTFGIFHRDSAGNEGAINTTESYRDLGRWLHLLVDYDSVNSTAADRISLYVNGVKTGVASGTRPGSGNHINVNVSGQTHRIGQDLSSTPNYHASCYLSQTLFLDNKSIAAGDYSITDFLGTPFTFGANGSQITPKSDAEITTIANAGGDQSSLLLYSNASDIDNDASSKNNDWSTSTVGSANQSPNTPSLVYPVMNPLDQDTSTATTLSDGNLKVSMSTTVGDGIRATMRCGGKIYFEVEIDSIATNSGSFIGIATSNHDLSVEAKGSGNRDAFVGINSFDSNLCGFISGSNFDASYGGLGNNFGTAGKYLMFAVDIDAGKFWGGYDGTWFNSGNPAAGSNDSGKNLSLYDGWMPAISRVGSAGSEVFIFNFGTSSFAHTPPTGFVSLNSANLTKPAHQGCDAFQSVTYSGNGSARAITTDIAPAWVWIKNRSQADEHKLVDIVRGVQKELSSDDASNAEQTDSNGVTAFGSSSFSLGSGANGYNDNTENFIAWCWEAGTAFSNDASATSIGTLDSSGRVNASDSLSIISYTGNATSGASIKHGLSAAPELVIHRERDNANGWIVGATDVGYTKMLRLDTTDKETSDSAAWNDTAPTSSIITLGNGNGTNRDGGAMICYAMRSVSGVCKVGVYEGNNSSDGPYISLGFACRWLLVKNVDTAGQDWRIYDSTLDAANPNIEFFKANADAAQISSSGFDFLADGVKARDNNAGFNSAVTFAYVAFADIASGAGLAPIYGR